MKTTAAKAAANPFLGTVPGRPDVGATDAESRIRMVASFTVEQCNRALHVPHLQKTVALAILRRVRKIKGDERRMDAARARHMMRETQEAAR